MNLIKLVLNIRNYKIIGILFILLTGCATSQKEAKMPGDLYSQALDHIEHYRYEEALNKLREIKNKFQNSPYSIKAHLKIAEVYFLDGSYLDSATTYEIFQELHPKHEKTPDAVFHAGEAYYKASPSNIAKDLTTLDKALDAFKYYKLAYPNGDKKDKTSQRIKEIEDKLASKEFYIANFYNKLKKYDSAKSRYEKIISKYPNSRVINKAKYRLKRLEEK